LGISCLADLLGAVTTDPLINILLAAGLTWAAHSSLAIVDMAEPTRPEASLSYCWSWPLRPKRISS
jgi:hypothetical protein